MDNHTLRQTTYRAGLLQSQAYRALTTFMNVQLERFSITLPEWSVMGLLILAEKPLRPGDLALQLAIKQPVATRLLQGLEKKELILRGADTADRRAVAISLTPKGRRTASEIEQKLRQSMKVFLAGIHPHELATYLKVMEQIAKRT